MNVGPEPFWTLNARKPASGVQGADVGTTAEPLDGFFAECDLGRPVTSVPFTGSAPNASHIRLPRLHPQREDLRGSPGQHLQSVRKSLQTRATVLLVIHTTEQIIHDHPSVRDRFELSRLGVTEV